VADESYRVLRPGKKCAILIGDTREDRHVFPIGFQTINVFLDAGFRLKELVIKRQYNCKTTGFWTKKSVEYNFLLLAHEYLPIFEKPDEEEHRPTGESSSYSPAAAINPVKPQIDESRELETTSVWLFPRNAYDSCLDSNVIRRYSKGEDYQVLTLELEQNAGKDYDSTKAKDLLFIKSPLLNGVISREAVAVYLQSVKDVVNNGLKTLEPGGFVVIQVQDARINGYVEPLAKRVLDSLGPMGSLWLKEIVVTTPEAAPSDGTDCAEDGDLQIVHKYLLVYEVKNDRKEEHI